jgi:hypothetical protein
VVISRKGGRGWEGDPQSLIGGDGICLPRAVVGVFLAHPV